MSYVYMLRCEDGTIYTGSTTNLERRLAAHKNRSSAAARYTKAHGVSEIAMVWEISVQEERTGNWQGEGKTKFPPDYILALKYEYRIKKLNKKKKLRLLEEPDNLEQYLPPEFLEEIKQSFQVEILSRPELRLG